MNVISKHVTAKELENYEKIAVATEYIFESGYPIEKINDVMTTYYIKNGGVYLRTGKYSYSPSALSLSMLAQHINDVVKARKGFVIAEKKTQTTMQGKRTTAKKTTRKPARK